MGRGHECRVCFVQRPCSLAETPLREFVRAAASPIASPAAAKRDALTYVVQGHRLIHQSSPAGDFAEVREGDGHAGTSS
ncbi:MAG: hypothetical protein WKF58_07490 [Ilumatobacteraceae bacterium]